MEKVGFIGCGNMGGALCGAAVRAIGKEYIYVSDFVVEKAKGFCAKTGARLSSNEEIAKTCKYIFLGVKPNVMESTIFGIRNILKQRTDECVIVSMAAGLSIYAIEKMLAFSSPVIRIMPNTSCSIGEGVVLYATNDNVTPDQTNIFCTILSKCGIIDNISENLIDAASAISGCGPAFVYIFAESLADGGVCCGLPRDKAIQYAAQTLIGAGQMLLQTGAHPGKLKDSVCSPGGTTIEGVLALERGAFRADAMSAVIKAYEKTIKLKK